VYEQISSNRRRTVLLVLGAFVLLGGVGYLLGTFLGEGGTGWAGLVLALIIAGVMSITSFFWGDRLVLASTRAKEVSAQEAPRLHNLVEGIAIAAGVPKPRIHIVPEQAPNAYATGRNPEHSSLAVTQGLLDSLNRVELEGVVAHEMAHIVDRDMLVNTLVATLVGAVVLISEFMLRWFWWGGFRGRRGSDRGGGATAVVAAIGLILAILAPLVGQLIKFAVSRRREYLADAQGAMLTRYPPGLAGALKKIAAAQGVPMRSANNATAHLWLSQPSRVAGDGMSFMEKLFSTHPPIQERIRILEEM
jgi:heat shock protein HtpX